MVDLRLGRRALLGELHRELRRFGVRRGELRAALAAAEAAQEACGEALRRRGAEALAALDRDAVVVIGRSYNAFARGMNLRIPEKLASLGVASLPMDMLPLEAVSIAPDFPDLYWRSGQRMVRAARFAAAHPRLHPIVIGSFGCGPDSFILKYLREELGHRPFLHIEIDEHSADAGALTRCEAFLDSIAGRPAPPPPQRRPPRRRPGLRGRTVSIPPMTDHALAVAAAFERCGVEAEVLPPSDRAGVEAAMRYVNGKECYPFIVTVGDLLRKVLAPGFEPSRAAFFMPGGSGPCRFGQYNVFQRQVLEKLGLAEVPVFSPNQDDGLYRELGAVGGNFPLRAWEGVVAIELLLKSLHETRPYERSRGECDELYRTHLARLVTALRGRNGGVETALTAARDDFAAVPRTGERRPLIAVIGELFVRLNRFSNEEVVRRIEALGGEAWLAPMEEWLTYLNHVNFRAAVRRRDLRGALRTALEGRVQRRSEHRLARIFRGRLRTLKEPSTARILRLAAPYAHHSFQGEAVLSVGKSVDFALRGGHGIVNAIPFGCLPGTVATALLRAFTRDHGVPVITIPYDGTEAATSEIQLEAFMEQARERARCAPAAVR